MGTRAPYPSAKSHKMKSIELLATGIRLVGFYILVLAAQSISRNFSMFYTYQSAFSDWTMFVAIVLVQIILMVLAGVILIKFPLTISKKLLPDTRGDEVLLQGDARDIQTALFCVLGVLILSWAIPDFIHNALSIWQARNPDNVFYADRAFYIVDEIVTVIEIGIGLYLCFGAHGLSGLLWRLKNTGLG